MKGLYFSMFLDFGTDFKTLRCLDLFKGHFLLSFSTIEQNLIQKHSMAQGNQIKLKKQDQNYFYVYSICLFDTKIKNVCGEMHVNENRNAISDR
jgi:hypothetical protein